MFSSCFNELESYCDQLIVSCDKRLLSLFERSFNNSIRFVDKDADVDESLYDAQAPAGTAFGFLRQEDQSFLDNKKPYLTSDSQMRNVLVSRLNEMGSGAKIVGISWKTSALKDAVKRSLDVSELVKEIPNDFLIVNLQYGDVKEELTKLQDSIGRSILQLDNVDNFRDLDEFSSLIKCPDEYLPQITSLLLANRDLFAFSEHELTVTDLIEADIDTADAEPINLRPYRTPLTQRQSMSNAIDKLLASGLISRSFSPWNFPCLMVGRKTDDLKSGGKSRLVVDFRSLNKNVRLQYS